MAISDKYRKHLNNSMKAAKDVLLGDIINNLNGMANQSASQVVITGGNLSGISASGLFNGILTGSISGSSVATDAALTDHKNLTGINVHGLGTISTQNASAVVITGGTLTGISASGAFSGSFTGNVFSGSARFGTGANYATFQSDGTLTFSGSATFWNDIFFPLLTAKQGQTDQPLFSTTEIAYLFPQADTSHIMYILAQMPHDWKIGSVIYPHVHWKQTQSGSVVYQMDYRWTSLGAQVSASTTYVMNVPEYPYTSGSLMQVNNGVAGISGSSIVGVSSFMLIKLYRNDNTYTGTAVTYQFDIHLERDSLGSSGTTTK